MFNYFTYLVEIPCRKCPIYLDSCGCHIKTVSLIDEKLLKKYRQEGLNNPFALVNHIPTNLYEEPIQRN